MDRKVNPMRGRLFAVRTPSPTTSDDTGYSLTKKEISGLALSFRMMFSEQGEIWTVRGVLSDGTPTRDDIGELSFMLLPGSVEAATAVVGFLAPPKMYSMNFGEEALWGQLRAMMMQLGYDLDGFYMSISVGGEARYFEQSPQGDV